MFVIQEPTSRDTSFLWYFHLMSDSGSLVFSLGLVVVRSVCAFFNHQVLGNAIFSAFSNVAALLVSAVIGWLAIDRITREES